MSKTDNNRIYLCMYNGERGVLLRPGEVWHPKPVMTSSGDNKQINNRNAKAFSAVFCEQFRDPAHNRLMLGRNLESTECEIWSDAPFLASYRTPRIQQGTCLSFGQSLPSQKTTSGQDPGRNHLRWWQWQQSRISTSEPAAIAFQPLMLQVGQAAVFLDERG